MRILHVDTGRQMRGGQWQVLYLCEGLVRAGHDCTLLSPEDSPLFMAARNAGIPTRPLGILTLAAASRRADITHAHDARAHSLSTLAAGGPWIVSRRVAFDIGTGPAARWKYSRARHFVAISKHVMQRLVAAGIDRRRISVVYDGVPVDIEPARAEWILTPQTSDPMKGADLVAQAAACSGIEVRFTRCLREDIKRARQFVYITRSEGLGSAVLLAMASGVPVIASAVGGLTEIIEHERTGLLTANSPEAIAAAMRRLDGNPALCSALADSARNRVREAFSVGALVANMLQVYCEVLSCSRQ
jgi:hypothetical protein